MPLLPVTPSPRAFSEGPRPRRGARLPSGADVPTVALRRDPGIQASVAAFESPLGVVAEELAPAAKAFAQGIIEKEEEQQRLSDTIAKTESKRTIKRTLKERFEAAKTQPDADSVEFANNFDESSKSLIEETLGNLSPDVSDNARQRLELELGTIRDGFYNDALTFSSFQRKLKAKDLVDLSINDIGNDVRESPTDLDQGLKDLDQLIEDNADVLNPNNERDKRSVGRAKIIGNALLGLAEQGDEKAAQKLLDSGRFDKDIDKAKIKAQIKTISKAREQEEEKANEALVSDLQICVARGNCGTDEIDNIFNTRSESGKRAISGKERTRLTLLSDKITKEENKKTDRIENIYSALRGETVVNPTADKKAINEAFGEIFTRLDGADEETITRNAVNFVSQLNALPTELGNQFKQYPNPAIGDETIVQYANLFREISRTNPKPLSALPANVRSYWANVNTLLNGGADTGLARETAFNAAFAMTPEDNVSIRLEYKDGKFNEGNKFRFKDFVAKTYPKDWLDRINPFAGREDAPTAMQADYNNLTKMFYLNTRNIDISRELAEDAMQNLWMADDEEFRKRQKGDDTDETFVGSDTGTAPDDRPDRMRTPPVDNFDPEIPQEYDPWNVETSFTDLLKTPVEAAEEGMVMNLIRWLEGKTEEAEKARSDLYRMDSSTAELHKRLGEMEKDGTAFDSEGDETQEYNSIWQEIERSQKADASEEDSIPSFSEIIAFAKENPKEFSAEFINALSTDLQLLFVPLGWQSAATRAGIIASRVTKSARALKAAQVAGGLGGTGTVGATLVSGISIADQLSDTGEVDPEILAEHAKTGFIFGAGAGAVFKFSSTAVNKLLKTSKATPEQTTQIKEKLKPESTAEEVKSIFEESGVSTKAIDGSAPKPKELANPSDELAADSVIDLGNPQAARNAKIRPINIDDATPEQKAFALMHQNRQAGSVSPKLLIAGGATAGIIAALPFVDEPSDVVAIGAAALAAKSLIKHSGAIKSAIQRIIKDDSVRIDKLMDQWEADVASSHLAAFRMMEKVKQLVPDPKRREAVTFAIEGIGKQELNKVEQAVAKSYAKEFDDLFELAKKEGVIDTHLENYVPHLWRQGPRSRSEMIEALKKSGVGSGKKTTTRFAKQRTLSSYKEGIDAGFEPITTDISEIHKIYASDVMQAIRTKQLIKRVSEEIDGDGRQLIMKTDKDTPQDYITINASALRGKAVHPDIAPSLQFMFSATDSNIIMRGLTGLNFAMKRSLVAVSAFHANALVESGIMSGINPITKIPRALEMLKNGKAGDVVDTAVRAGLKLGTIEDVGADAFYGMLSDVRRMLDDVIPYLGTGAIAPIQKVSKTIDTVMWDKIATGSKLAVFMKEYETAILRNAELHAKDPVRFRLESPEEIAVQVAQFTNDAFGGLNWRRIAEGTRTKFGRELTLAAYSPKARQMMQLLLFAPDWTIANIRVLRNALTGQTKGIRKMHQAYAARGAAMFLIAGSAVNSVINGRYKPIWENENPTRIDMGDGRQMVFSKQFIEPWHWLHNPAKTAINKAGTLPKEVLSQLMTKEYITAFGGPTMKDSSLFGRTRHVGGNFVPIFTQQLYDDGFSAGASGFLGHPIYGQAAR